MDKYDEGKIFINGTVQKMKSPGQAIKQGIGYLTEDRKTQGLILQLSVGNNICLSSLSQFSSFGIIKNKLVNEAAKKYVSNPEAYDFKKILNW